MFGVYGHDVQVLVYLHISCFQQVSHTRKPTILPTTGGAGQEKGTLYPLIELLFYKVHVIVVQDYSPAS